MAGARDIRDYRLLLKEAGRLYEKHEAGRPESFNVFSVLRSETDEVNLHSRFLHALLDYRQSPEGHRENLEDFLCELSFEVSDLVPNRAVVDRERGNIDILIRDPNSMRAVVIENKIWAGDQPKQLRRYAGQLNREGYTPHLLYLTLDGHKPSTDSVRDLKYECISYKEDLSPWLKRCQQRAYNEPGLRESVAQYLHLIAKLTGKDYSEAYMSDLKNLCLQDDHLVLVHDLNEAMVEARVSLLCKFWDEINCNLMEVIPDLPEPPKDSDTEGKIRGIVLWKRNQYLSLAYKLNDCANLGVEAASGHPFIYFGVACSKKDHEEEHYKFKEALEGYRNTQMWPCLRDYRSLNLKNPTREELGLLANKETRQKYVAELVSGVRELWEKIKKANLA